MLRVKSRDEVKFWVDNFGFTHLASFSSGSESVDYVGSLSDAERKDWESPKSEEDVWTLGKPVLELRCSGTDEEIFNGNSEPGRGFGHVAVGVPDVYKACADLEANGVAFRKKPDEGRMKGLAFALSPSGYWIEVVRRVGEVEGFGDRPILDQTMIRVKDPKPSLEFYTKKLGMTLLVERHFGPDQGDFSLYFVASLPEGTEYPLPDGDQEATKEFLTSRDLCAIELTHNHGTEKEPGPTYENGEKYRGFGHIGFCVDADSDLLKEAEPNETTPGKFLRDPDGYLIEITSRS